MKRLSLGIIGIALWVGTSVGGAFAADMAVKAPPAPPPPAWTWTGLYIGVNGGGGWYTHDDPFTVQNNLGVTVTGPGYRPKGAFGGIQAGANYQINNVVIGIEADFDAADIKGGYANAVILLPAAVFAGQTNVHSFETVRGRIGLTWGQALLYATGGYAGADIRNFYNISGAATGLRDGNVSGSAWGGGIEYAFGNNWSAKAEYLYFRMGSYVTNAPVVPPNGIVVTNAPFSNNFQVVRVGLNYKLNWWPAH